MRGRGKSGRSVSGHWLRRLMRRALLFSARPGRVASLPSIRQGLLSHTILRPLHSEAIGVLKLSRGEFRGANLVRGEWGGAG